MRGATDLLVQYATTHRDRRNIASHFVCVPMMVFALGVLLAKPAFVLVGWTLSPAWIAFAAAAVWYLTRGNLALGLAVNAAIGVLVALAQRVGDSGTGAWLAWGVGFLVAGGLVQFIGHWYEGRKPALGGDPLGFLVGPMFVVAEALFSFGWGKALLAEIERRAGPTVLRDLARIA
ncbi:DUF962 domain-containing protein [Piscinibacter sp.]|uniref:Mpo1 family 2-hydroxy fatty acid dioxygenase n=1 Tax=Piscinibacter sp. TaxID=1903157 RepID=UPI0039E4B583